METAVSRTANYGASETEKQLLRIKVAASQGVRRKKVAT